MFLNNKSAYVHMPKTGGSHIITLLSLLTNGEEVGDKHGAASQNVINSEKYIVSSIRNPWDWYISLWTYGVQGHGALMKRLTLSKNKSLSNVFKKDILRPNKYGNLAKIILYRMSDDIKTWRSVYNHGRNIKSFRKWLKLIHDPNQSHRIMEGYENTAIQSFCGLMTYRYLSICCKNVEQLNCSNTISDYSDLTVFENENCYIDYFIRQESLENDLCEFIEEYHNQPISGEQKLRILKKDKTNTSNRNFKISDYYDEESANLVFDRERLIVEKFDYSPPFMTEHIMNSSQNLKGVVSK